MYHCMFVCRFVRTVSKIVWFAAQFATKNCYGCFLKMNLGSKNFLFNLPLISLTQNKERNIASLKFCKHQAYCMLHFNKLWYIFVSLILYYDNCY